MTKKLIKQLELEEGMILANDIVSPEGVFLVAKGTCLTPAHIVKINVHTIDTIYISVEEVPSTHPIPKPLTETAAFIEFSFKYEEQAQTVGQELAHIVATGDIQKENLDTIVTDILNITTSESNLFSYMCRLTDSDEVTYTHSMNVSLLAGIFGKWLHLPKATIKDLTLAGLLHDIGKIRLDQTILNKPDKLTKKEFEHLKQHPSLGYELIAKSSLSLGVKQAVLMHHEKMNGAGYPLGLSWERIHDFAKIVAIVDIYDAMTAERPYHTRFHPFYVIQTLEEECYGVLDSKFLYIFLEHIAHNFLGDQVLLSNKQIGNILFINQHAPSRPLIQLENGEIIDLLTTPHLKIKTFL